MTSGLQWRPLEGAMPEAFFCDCCRRMLYRFCGALGYELVPVDEVYSGGSFGRPRAPPKRVLCDGCYPYRDPGAGVCECCYELWWLRYGDPNDPQRQEELAHGNPSGYWESYYNKMPPQDERRRLQRKWRNSFASKDLPLRGMPLTRPVPPVPVSARFPPRAGTKWSENDSVSLFCTYASREPPHDKRKFKWERVNATNGWCLHGERGNLNLLTDLPGLQVLKVVDNFTFWSDQEIRWHFRPRDPNDDKNKPRLQHRQLMARELKEAASVCRVEPCERSLYRGDVPELLGQKY